MKTGYNMTTINMQKPHVDLVARPLEETSESMNGAISKYFYAKRS